MSTAEPAEAMRGTWKVVRMKGSVASLHARTIPDGVRAEVWLHEIDERTLVLGSSQRTDDDVVARAANRNLAVARRRSGGGAVLLDAREVIWIDVLIGRDHQLWSDDVGRAFGWLGAAWVDALRSVGLPVRNHTGGHVASEVARAVCFAGLGHGEVVIDGTDADGAKLVGISQRRTRAGARFQCAVLRIWNPSPWSDLVLAGDENLDDVAIGYEQIAGVGTIDAARVTGSFLDVLAAI